jgi:phenylalanyl-tRNA synthetase beta chain
MLLSLSWLREFVDLGDRSPEQIAFDLTMKTALIEGIVVRGVFDTGLVVGKVVAKERHPQADRLSVCSVDVGRERLQIVCGAPNVAVGQTVAVATPGSKLPDGRTIGAAKLRGVDSCGMICSEQELGLSEEHGGILVLEDELVAGTRLSDVRAMSDVVLEIDNKSITHRPDLWCHEGFARELAAIYRQPLRRAEVASDLRAGQGRKVIRLEAGELCGRYALLSIDGDVGRAAPAWMRRRLTHCGLRPHSLLVDLSNYMLLEIGQPTHPFDAAKLRGETIVVRKASPDEKLVTLDGVERTMPAGGLMIGDDVGAIAIAGVMGGESTSMSPSARSALLESAWFDPIAVRRTATAVGLRTDASARFEKNLDCALAERGVRRFAALVREIAPDLAVAATFGIAGDKTPARATVRLRPDRLRAKLGASIDNATIEDLLARLECRLTARGGEIDVEVPSFRATRDVLGEDDVIEEVEHIEAVLPRAATRAVEFEPDHAAWRTTSQYLRDHAGFAEVMSYPYAEDAQLARVGGGGDEAFIVLKNPLQQSARRLRRSLVPALVEFVDRNVRQAEEARLFECGRVFRPVAGSRDLPNEPLLLGAVLAQRSVKRERAGESLRRLKGALEALAPRLERHLAFGPLSAGDRPQWAHPGRAAAVLAGERRIGVIAELVPSIANGIARTGEIALAEIDVSAWVATPRVTKPYQAVPRFPAVTFDVSFVAPFSLTFAQVTRALRDGTDGTALRDIAFVDEYFAPPIEAGKRSLTLRLTFRSDERTLTAQEVTSEVERVRARLAELGGELRGG